MLMHVPISCRGPARFRNLERNVKGETTSPKLEVHAGGLEEVDEEDKAMKEIWEECKASGSEARVRG